MSSMLDNPPHTCEVYRMTFTRTPGGLGNVETPARVLGGDVDDPLRCWVQNASSAEILQWAKRDWNVTHRVSFFHSKPDLRLGDEIRILTGPTKYSSDAHVGALLKFLGLVERTAGYGIAFVAYCEIER